MGDSVRDLLEKLPDFLGAKDLLAVARAVVKAKAGGRSVMMAFGAHVIKVGVSPLIIDLLEAGLVSSLATNGAGMIHDFEIAFAGHTSEDVDTTLGSGDVRVRRRNGRRIERDDQRRCRGRPRPGGVRGKGSCRNGCALSGAKPSGPVVRAWRSDEHPRRFWGRT